MSRKNSGFAADLTAGIDLSEETAPRRPTIAGNVLTGRANRIAELASGAVVSRTHELVDPARCRMWAGHNRDYALLNEERCSDLIESIKAQGRQEMPAIVRRVSGEADYDFEVICGARRHWTISWLRSHNYPDFKFHGRRARDRRRRGVPPCRHREPRPRRSHGLRAREGLSAGARELLRGTASARWRSG